MGGMDDSDGLIARFAEAARAQGLSTVFGAEVTLGITGHHEPGQADAHGQHAVILARDPVGYARLARALSEAQLAGEKGAPHATLDQLTTIGTAGGSAADHWVVLTGCRKSPVPAALERDGPRAARRAGAAATGRENRRSRRRPRGGSSVRRRRR